MPDKRLISHDPMYGLTEYFIADESGDGFTIETVQHTVNDIVDANKADYNMVSKSDRWGDGKLVARIPMEIYNQWLANGWIRDEAKLKSLLNDPDNRFMRIWPGTL
jgi:hypothetical protein